jgi:drug/metabolite transporter (DMT)-like permease
MTTNREPDRFDRLPRRTQGLLLALLMFAFSAVAFFMGLQDLHPGKAVLVTAGGIDYSDDFFWSAAAFVLGACLLAVALGWKIPKRWLRDSTAEIDRK